MEQEINQPFAVSFDDSGTFTRVGLVPRVDQDGPIGTIVMATEVYIEEVKQNTNGLTGVHVEEFRVDRVELIDTNLWSGDSPVALVFLTREELERPVEVIDTR